MKLKFLILLLLFTLLVSCKTDESGLSRREKKILKECYKTVIESAPYLIDSTYIVNPYFDSFDFNQRIANSYKENGGVYRKNDKLLDKVGLSEKDFEILQKEINEEFQNKRNPYLETLSKHRKSKRIITFSGIGEKIIYVEYITYLEEIDLDEFKNKPISIDDKKIKDIIALVFILEGSNIKEFIVDGGIVFER
jgi:hypothetical protein